MLNKLLKYAQVVLGMTLIAVAFNLFISPLKIVAGGTNAIAVILNELFGVNEIIFIAIFYILSLILSLIVFGLKGSKSVILGSIFYPIFLMLTSNIKNYIILDYSNELLMYFIAAALLGIGNGLVYKNDYICGGTDVIKKIINKKLKKKIKIFNLNFKKIKKK